MKKVTDVKGAFKRQHAYTPNNHCKVTYTLEMEHFIKSKVELTTTLNCYLQCCLYHSFRL